MLKLLGYLLTNGVVTEEGYGQTSTVDGLSLPTLSSSPCQGQSCGACVDLCPTDAIILFADNGQPRINLDLGACIGCALCIENCPTGTIAASKSYRTAVRSRRELMLSQPDSKNPGLSQDIRITQPLPEMKTPWRDRPELGIFRNSLSARVVSTGCTASDLEIGASTNPIFDLDRFGVHITASPRFADALLVTGPVPKAMHEPLLRCYHAMADPKLVIAVGTCAISGGVHKGGYAEANGVDSLLAVDVYIPGCPPHPWSIIYGILLAMGKVPT